MLLAQEATKHQRFCNPQIWRWMDACLDLNKQGGCPAEEMQAFACFLGGSVLSFAARHITHGHKEQQGMPQSGTLPPDLTERLPVPREAATPFATGDHSEGEAVYIGVDGGGTKTLIVAVNALGVEIGRAQLSSSNHNSVGKEQAQSVLQSGLTSVMAQVGAPSPRGSLFRPVCACRKTFLCRHCVRAGGAAMQGRSQCQGCGSRHGGSG